MPLPPTLIAARTLAACFFVDCSAIHRWFAKRTTTKVLRSVLLLSFFVLGERVVLASEPSPATPAKPARITVFPAKGFWPVDERRRDFGSLPSLPMVPFAT